MKNVHAPDPLEALLARIGRGRRGFGTHAVIDVGANKGQSYHRFRALMPEARIHCFEPAPETFGRLKRAVQADELAVANPMALGSVPGQVRFSTGLGTNNHRVAAEGEGTDVPVETGDAYCAQRGIKRIDFLKVDTEGYDLDVLAGFTGMLREGRVTALQVETTTSLDNKFHVHLERFIHFLHPFNYRLSDLIEPHRKVNKTGQKLHGIWFCNGIFVREVDAPKLRRDGIN